MITIKHIDTPLGKMRAGAFEDALCLLEFDEKNRIKMQEERLHKLYSCDLVESEHTLIDELSLQLEAYFSGERKVFDLPLDIRGGTFRQRIWELLLTIPYGQTISYLELSEMYGDKKAIRAVGTANGANRIAIVVPCHRVIGKNGSLVGYGGELWRKKKLLDLESQYVGRGLQLEMNF